MRIIMQTLGGLLLLMLTLVGMGWYVPLSLLIWLRNKVFGGDPYCGNEGVFIEFYGLTALMGAVTLIGLIILPFVIAHSTAALITGCYIGIATISGLFYLNT